eukprot:Hpha_TRINITY_DN31302_c0_g1::TRINITY_DN31302_c0_g1_i1::g.194519::m.194519
MSLGWITESTIFPRTSRPIEGVSQGTIVQMRAEIFRHKQSGGGGGSTGGSDAVSSGGTTKSLGELLRNPGVDARAKRDLEELARARDSKGKLQEKADLYERLRTAASHLPESDTCDLLVDFELKPDQPRDRPRGGLEMSKEGAKERQRFWDATIAEAKAEGAARRERRTALRKVIGETAAAREAAQQRRGVRRKKMQRRLELARLRRRLPP